MKRFSLEEYLKNPSKKIVTRSGRDVRIICTDKYSGHPIVALVRYDDAESLICYDMNGRMWGATEDLFFATEKHEGWINVYKSGTGWSLGTNIWPTEEEAKEWIGAADYVTTIKIEWEE